MSTSSRIASFEEKKVVSAVIEEVAKVIANDIVNEGISTIESSMDIYKTKKVFSDQIGKLEYPMGALFGYFVFELPDGKKINHGPVAFGYGKKPADPLINIGFSNRAIREMGFELANVLNLSKPIKWNSIKYYWAIKMPDESTQLFKIDSKSIHAEAIGFQLRHQIIKSLSTSSDNLIKLKNQTLYFDQLENKLRTELRNNNLEAELIGIRSKIREAKSLYMRATYDRTKALNNLNTAKALDNLSKTLGLVTSFASFINNSQSKADYHKTEIQNSTNNYNINIKSYIEIINNTSYKEKIPEDKFKLSIPLG